MTKQIDEFTDKEQHYLLMYLETCVVDHGGLVDCMKMSKDEFTLATQWNKSRFISFGRIKFSDVERMRGKYTHWCEFSEDSWIEAHKQRRARAERMMKVREWEKVST